MFEKRFYVEGLAHASHPIGAGGEAAVIDPKCDVDDYLETHPQSDFVSGEVELAQRIGVKIYVSHLAPVHDQDGDPVNPWCSSAR